MSPTQAQVVTMLVVENPGKTASELARIGDLEQVQVVRRLSELRSERAVRKGEHRKCEVTGSQAATWWPADEKIKRVPVSEIRIDGGTQPRESIDETLVNEYAEAMKAGDKFPAVVVFFDGVSYWLADGFHRTHAARRAELADLTAEIHSGTKRDAMLYSVGANAAHGQRRTNADKRKAVMTLLEDEEWSTWTDSEIARQCAVSQPFVGKIRSSLITVLSEKRPTNADKHGEQPKGRTYTTKHGTTATMNTSNIGKRSTNADKRNAVIEALSDPDWSQWTDRAIAEQCGVHTKTVEKIRHELGLHRDGVSGYHTTASGQVRKPRSVRVQEISELAEQGYRASQIATQLQVGEAMVRKLAIAEDIQLADSVVGKTRSIKADRVIDHLVNGLEGYAISVTTIENDLEGLEPSEAEEWAAAIAEALKPINRLRKKLTEIAYD